MTVNSVIEGTVDLEAFIVFASLLSRSMLDVNSVFALVTVGRARSSVSTHQNVLFVTVI